MGKHWNVRRLNSIKLLLHFIRSESSGVVTIYLCFKNEVLLR